MKRKINEDISPDIKEKDIDIIGFEQKAKLMKKEGLEVDYRMDIERSDLAIHEIRNIRNVDKVRTEEQKITQELNEENRSNKHRYSDESEMISKSAKEMEEYSEI